MSVVTSESPASTVLYRSSNLSAQTSGPADNINPLTPCPREIGESIVGLVIALLIIASNVACMKVAGHSKASQHPGSRTFIVNLAVSNLLCGIALLVTNSMDFLQFSSATRRLDETGLLLCQIWSPVYIYCIMTPYVALTVLSIDIAYYCHRPLDYQRRMSTNKRRASIAVGWIYPFVVIFFSVLRQFKILCDKDHWQLNVYIIIFPIMLMLLPAITVVFVFAYIIRRYWITTSHLAKETRMVHTSSGDVTISHLVRRFLKKFLHLIVFSIICGFIYTILLISEVSVEANNHIRICIMFRLDRLCITLNSLISPWIYCLATRENRLRSKRKLKAWWWNSGSQFDLSGKSRRRTRKSKTTGNSEPHESPRKPQDNSSWHSADILSDGEVTTRTSHGLPLSGQPPLRDAKVGV